jgi:HEAT repeat protein/thioredoxin-like negative regulator of GroEL
MRNRHSFLLAAALGLPSLWPLLLPAIPVFAQTAPTSAPAASAPATVAWETNYDTASQIAKAAGKPLLVIFGAPWCEACHTLNEQLKSADVQKELRDLARVYVDFDANHDLAHKMGVGPIPALRVLSVTGRTVAVNDGILSAPELADWLREAKKAAAQTVFDAALDADDLSDDAIAKLVGMFGDPDTVVREAAIRHLLPHAEKAAAPVVEAFIKGNLAQRLSALDLLDSWHAPVEKLDPWRADTMTDDRLAALKKWAATPQTAQTNPALDERRHAEARDLLQRYLQVADDGAPALRERLARFGTALLPDIYAALKDASTDATRHRLTFLRYRVAASDALALQWPTGIERLAAPEVTVRHSALDELSNRVTARDSGLLLELFSDPDALVRETALRLLQQVGGPSATDALAGLLSDPDPNVRAAVLKSVADSPTAQMTAKVADFALHEKDVDLIVHAARVLRNAKGTPATKALYSLLENASWRVRAEAAEALAQRAGGRSSAPPAQQADFYMRMLDLLDDPDGFVASRALSALEGASGLPSVAKIAATADKHPELAALAVKVIANNAASDRKAGDYLRNFFTHKDAAVRAAAIENLSETLKEGAAAMLHTALADTDQRVRTTASKALMDQLDELLPESEFQIGSTGPSFDYQVFLVNFHAGKGRPPWLATFRPDLEKLLEAADPQEKVLAALPLIALGFKDKALPVLKDTAIANPKLMFHASLALRWLNFGDRLELFKALQEHAAKEDIPRLANSLAAGDDPRAADPLWELLADSKADWTLASSLDSILRSIMVGNSYRDPTSTRKKEVAQALAKHLNSGGEISRTVALVILVTVDPLAAADAAGKIREDPHASPAFQRDAAQIQLSQLPRAQAEETAAALLSPEDSPLRQLMLDVLTHNTARLRYLHDEIYISGAEISEGLSTGSPIVPTAPKGLQAQQVRPLLEDKNPLVAAEAGYLLALLKDRSGLEKLLSYYQKNANDHDFICRLVYRAITALDDDDLTPVLNDIYKTLAKSGSYELREFYWTIRSMTGDKCVALRKHIRDEVGMEALR